MSTFPLPLLLSPLPFSSLASLPSRRPAPPPWWFALPPSAPPGARWVPSSPPFLSCAVPLRRSFRGRFCAVRSVLSLRSPVAFSSPRSPRSPFLSFVLLFFSGWRYLGHCAPLREIGVRVMADVAASPLSRRASNSARSSASPPHSPDAHQAFLRPEPRRQARITRAEPITTDPARPDADRWTDARGSDGCRRCAPGRCSSSAGPPRRSTEQARPVAPGHLQELLQPRPHRGLARRRHCPAHPPQQLHQPSPHLLRRPPPRSGIRATRLTHLWPPAPPATGRPSPPPTTSNCRSRLKPPGKPPARDATWSSWRRSGSADRASSARGRRGGSPRRSGARTARVPRTTFAAASSSPSSASFSALRSIGRMPRTRFFNSFLAWRSAS